MYEVSAGVRSTRNEDGGIVLNVRLGKIFRLNGMGALIFDRLRERRDEAEIINEISEAFQLPGEIIRADVIAFLKSLEQQGLVISIVGHPHDNQAT